MTIETITVLVQLTTIILLGISCGLYWGMRHTVLAWMMLASAVLTAASLLMTVTP